MSPPRKKSPAKTVVPDTPADATAFTLVDAAPAAPPAKAKKPRTKKKVAPVKSTGAKARKPRTSVTSRLLPYVDKVGVLSDAQVASLAGLTRAAVQMYRRRRGIQPAAAFAPKRTRVKAEPKGVQIVEALPAVETPEVESPASAAPSLETVLPPRAKRKVGRPSKIDQYIDQVGVLPDEALARLAGVALSTVKSWARTKHGIRRTVASPPRGRPRRAAAPAKPPAIHAPVPAATAEPPSRVEAEPAPIPAGKGRTLCLVERVETMLAALARMRGVDADAAISVAIVEDYLRCRAALGRDPE